MSRDDIAVSVKDLSKIYHLWDSQSDRVVVPLRRLAASIMPSWLVRFKEEQLKGAREFYALRDISLEIKKGESWGFIGVNGSGKSTLLKIISGNLRPSAGRVEIDGKVAILDYGSGFNGEFTGKENIYIKATLMGLTRKQINERYDSIIEFAELGSFINQPVRTYSSGMVSRLGFAIMAHVDADIIITDEALAVGDVFFVQKCMKFIRSFLKKGTFLFVSHSMNDVLSLCQNAVWLERGKMKAIGSAADVTHAYLDKQILTESQAIMNEQNGDDAAPEQSVFIESGASLSQPTISRLLDYKEPAHYIDMRLKYPVAEHNRNDIHVMPADFIQESGIGGAEITKVSLVDENGTPCSCIVGSELVTLTIDVMAKRKLQFPIVGFQLLDRLGQVLIADNSSVITQHQAFSAQAGQIFTAEFCFQIPLLPTGDYVMRAAVAEGETDGHAVMLHVVENALALHSVTAGSRHGLIGVPMKEMSLKLKRQDKEAG